MHTIDTSRNTQDSGVMGKFVQIGIGDGVKECYCGVIENIFKIDFRTFHKYILDVKWFEGVAKRYGSGIYVVDHTKHWKGNNDTYVLPKHCEQVFLQRSMSLNFI